MLVDPPNSFLWCEKLINEVVTYLDRNLPSTQLKGMGEHVSKGRVIIFGDLALFDSPLAGTPQSHALRHSSSQNNDLRRYEQLV